MIDLNKALNLDPNDEIAYFKRGIIKLDLEDFRGAIADFCKSIEIKPGYSEAIEYRGLAKYKIKDYLGAVTDNNKAIEFDPFNAKNYYQKGLIEVLNLNLKENGCLNLSKVGELGFQDAYIEIKKICN